MFPEGAARFQDCIWNDVLRRNIEKIRMLAAAIRSGGPACFDFRFMEVKLK
jgi:hypothetical protein